MFKSVKGKFVAASCRRFDKLPSQEIRDKLTAVGWGFRTIHGSGGEDDIYVIVHPDGSPVAGYNAPHFGLYGDRTREQEKLYRQSCRKRWKDFARACANPERRLAGKPYVPRPPEPVNPAGPVKTAQKAISFTFQV